jgi:hypothetical protein
MNKDVETILYYNIYIATVNCDKHRILARNLFTWRIKKALNKKKSHPTLSKFWKLISGDR